jgi:hypothetical protein
MQQLRGTFIDKLMVTLSSISAHVNNTFSKPISCSSPLQPSISTSVRPVRDII